MSIFLRNVNVLSRQLLKTIHNPRTADIKHIKRWVAPTLKELKRRRDKIGPEPLRKRSEFLEWNYDAEIYAFGKRLGEEFDDEILRKSLIHRSYVIQQELKQEREETTTTTSAPTEIAKEDNSHLIEAGKEIIKNYLNKALQNQYPEEPAEALHKYLTADDMLSHVAKHLGLTDLILSEDFPVENSTLARTFEAVIGALNESSGLERAELFLKDFLLTQLSDKDIFDIWEPEKPYEYFIGIAKELGYKDVEPRLCNESATNTILANYQVGLYSNKKLIGLGYGETIENAKDTAALDAIQKIKLQNFNKKQALQ
ncbi:39S ribosomal protein L44, mitochondrial [Agrilus planipennis]|uniref:Large ribosomal subunit protein mL44 n=1 Tax=Agrilus planipennis TaxID=224129 RepID=A0A1W4XMH6_AGRPL|nr:39S ribosomal protein L44, mitochondrial [Agrilus planipennis]